MSDGIIIPIERSDERVYSKTSEDAIGLVADSPVAYQANFGELIISSLVPKELERDRFVEIAMRVLDGRARR